MEQIEETHWHLGDFPLHLYGGCTVSGSIFYRSTLDQNGSGQQWVGILTALQIKTLNFIYKFVARYLTDWENLETSTLYYNSLAIKLFLFQFINSYASLFHIAFAKSSFEECTDQDCMSELAIQLGSIYITNLVLNLLELGVPYLLGKWKLSSENKKVQLLGGVQRISQEERESKLSTYETPLDDYMEVVIAYGYIVLFGVAFPFTPLLGLLLTVVELRVDAWKLCNLTRRPFPDIADSIGVWMKIMQTIAVIGCATNTALIIFTTDVFDFKTAKEQWIWFLVIEHLLIIFKLVVSVYIPNTPYKVKQGIEWSERVMNEKLFNRQFDSDAERKQRNLHFKPDEGKRNISMEELLEIS